MKIFKNKRITLLLGVIVLFTSSCNGVARNDEKKLIKETITNVDIAADSLPEKKLKLVKKEKPKEHKLKAKIVPQKPGDGIIGVWEVQNDHYMAVYEIIRVKEEYLGMIHYYSNGKREIKTDSIKVDYFLSNVFFRDGEYTLGKIYMPDGEHYAVEISLKDDEIKASMVIAGSIYNETWKREKKNVN